jgi:peptidoglycan/LPS O-acetylase OafA/YrhL
MFSSSCWQAAEDGANDSGAGRVPRAAAHAPHRFYQPELDGLRFYAFLGVFIFHTLPGQAAFYRGLHLPLPWLWGAVARSGAAGSICFLP